MLKFIEIIEMTENRENEWVKGNGVRGFQLLLNSSIIVLIPTIPACSSFLILCLVMCTSKVQIISVNICVS
jgi:hypothetical protein